MKVFFVSLGCDKNLVDSEMMLGILSKEGFELTDDENEAEIAVINTCSFIHDAKQESVNAILEMADLKDNGSLKVLLYADVWRNGIRMNFEGRNSRRLMRFSEPWQFPKSWKR